MRPPLSNPSDVALIIHRLGRVASTQDEARRLLDAGEAAAGHVIVADAQEAGRGRFGRIWLSPVGGLYATFLVKQDPRLPLAAGVAVVEALARFGVSARLKWPNDALIAGLKVAGLLIETVEGLALLGIGINLEAAPLDTATSLRAAGGSVRRGELLIALGDTLAAAIDADDLVAAYRKYLDTLGRPVRVFMGDGTVIEGTAVDIDDDGQLVLETDSGLRVIPSGECHHLRPSLGQRASRGYAGGEIERGTRGTDR